jgi:hypothetical protein
MASPSSPLAYLTILSCLSAPGLAGEFLCVVYVEELRKMDFNWVLKKKFHTIGLLGYKCLISRRNLENWTLGSIASFCL